MKSRNRKNQKSKALKRTEKGAREVMHEMKRRQNMLDNIDLFKDIMKEFAQEKGHQE